MKRDLQREQAEIKARVRAEYRWSEEQNWSIQPEHRDWRNDWKREIEQERADAQRQAWQANDFHERQREILSFLRSTVEPAMVTTVGNSCFNVP